MRNLELWDVSVQKLKVNTANKFCICTGHDEDNTTKSIYTCTSSLIVNSYDAATGEIRWTSNIAEYATVNNKPVNVTCLSLQNFLCIGLQNGEMLTVRDAGRRCQPVGVFNSGLCAMEWSPDHEMVCLVTQEMNTCLLSCAFEPVCEVNLWDQDFGTKQFITVGWGKKETQFHGSAGKQAAKLKAESIDLYTVADKSVKIAWRGDGVLYAVGFSMDGIRRFKVFDREGRLMYTSEKQPALESNIAWRPCGNVIATTQKLPDKYSLTFFEKNGLKHGGFTVNVNSNTEIQNVLWSTDSEILTIQCHDTETNTQKLLLYTTGNYHWYLKQTLEFNSEQKINAVTWDADFDVTRNKTLHVSLQNGEYYSYSWVWNTNHSLGTTTNDDAVVVVIDEKKLLITGLRHGVVPPPMAAVEIPMDTYVDSVHFVSKHAEQDVDSNTFFVCTSDNKLIFYEETQKFPLQYQEQKVIQFEKYDFPHQYYNWQWVSADTIVCVTIDKDCCYILQEYTIKDDSLVKKCFAHIHGAITLIIPHPIDSTKLLLQLKSAEMIEYTLGGSLEPIDPCCKVACPTIGIATVREKLYYITLTYTGSLYINNVLALPSVSSFFIHTHFLLITTLQHVLLCTELNETGFNAIKEFDRKETEPVYKRKIERGARIVVTVPCDTRTVFQMPRGNIEVIQPRPLSLKIIGEYLDSLKYYEAFDLMRKQRINLNLIYDHNPEKFVENIDLFLETIKNNAWLNLFLSDLENSDVTKTMYANCYVGKPDAKHDNNAKIENICNMVREQISKRPDSDSKVLPLITTYVKKNTVEELEKALAIIKELKIQESGGSKLPVGSDEALKYLLYMVDVNQLFDVALGMYDFDLVLLVANKSQRDPKEFIPMLNELNDMNENYKRFTINKHLKRFNRAVECLIECGPSRHEELRTFVKYHSLYKEALAKFSSTEETYKQISEDFGLHLKLKKQYTTAGIVYERAKSFDKAVECFKDALEWEMALKLAHAWPEKQFKELCWDLVNDLKEEKRHIEALLILEQFYGDFEKTLTYALECGHYKTALRLCGQHRKDNYLAEKLLPVLKADYKNIVNLIERNSEDFTKYKDRLQTVREIKRAPADKDGNHPNKDWEMFSDVASTLASSSRASSRSHRSSKNKRKHERKMASLKEGSQFEDVAIVMHLHTLVTSCFDMRLQVKEVATALVFFEMEKDALHLQNALETLLNNMKDSLKTIWTHELTLEAVVLAVHTESQILKDSHLRVAPVIQEINWKFESFE